MSARCAADKFDYPDLEAMRKRFLQSCAKKPKKIIVSLSGDIRMLRLTARRLSRYLRAYAGRMRLSAWSATWSTWPGGDLGGNAV